MTGRSTRIAAIASLVGAAGAVAGGRWAVGHRRRWRALGSGGLSANWRAIAHMTRVTG